MTAPQATEPSAEAPTVSPLRLGGLSKQERRLTTRFAGGSNGDRMLRVSMLFDHRGYSLPSLAKENIHEVVQCGQPRGDADGGQEAPSSRAPNWRSGVLVKDGSRRPHPKKKQLPPPSCQQLQMFRHLQGTTEGEREVGVGGQ